MSLTAKSSTDKENIKALFRNFTGLILLQDHAKPSNYIEVVNAINDRFQSKEQVHLLCADFNRTATSLDSESKMVKLQTLRNQQATKASKTANPGATNAKGTGLKKVQPPQPKSSQDPDEEAKTKADEEAIKVKQEHPGYNQLGMKSADQVITYTEAGAARVTTIAQSGVLFSDPLCADPSKPEPTVDRALRMDAWSFMKAVCYHHPTLLVGLRAGDINGLWIAIKTFAGDHQHFDTIMAIKPPPTSIRRE